MNTILYFNPKTGEKKRVTIQQPSYEKISNYRFGQKRRGTMREVDELMAKQGFVRGGRRWASRATLRAIRAS